jgi:hypothetical protein
LYLQSAYNKKGDVFTFFRQLMCLPFLPMEHIEDMFHHLDSRATEEMDEVMAYVFKTWISTPIFPIDSWSVHNLSIRTNNDVEGWHNRLNSRVNLRGPVPFYLCVCELFQEANAIPMQLRMISENKLRRIQRKQTTKTQGKLFALWDDYTDKLISTSTLLKECATLYGPSVEQDQQNRD